MSEQIASTGARNGNRLAYSGGIPDAVAQARWARRLGWWGYMQHYLRTMRGYGWPVALEAIGTPLLYLVAMGVGLGSMVDRHQHLIDGVRYLTFVAPALMVSTVIQAAGTENTYPVMSGFKWHRLYWGAAATPMSPAQIALGHQLGACVRYLVQALCFWAMCLLFGAVHGVGSVLMVPVAVLAALAFGAPLQAYASTIEQEGAQFNFVQRFIIMPMSLFAGTMYPLATMPAYLRWIGWISPWWHGSQLARRAGFGLHEPAWLTGVHVAYLLVLAVAGLLVSRRTYTRRLTS